MARRLAGEGRGHLRPKHARLSATAIALLASLSGCGTGDSSSAAIDAGPQIIVLEASTSVDTGAGTIHVPSYPNAVFSAKSIDFGLVNCGARTAIKAIGINNTGAAPLVISAKTAGPGFSVSPSMFVIGPSGVDTFSVGVDVSSSAIAGMAILGALNFFTNDPGHATQTVSLSVTPQGATVVFPNGLSPALAFPLTEVGNPAAALPFTIANMGNSPATLTLGVPSDPQFSLSVPSMALSGIALAAGAKAMATAGFTPKTMGMASATSAVTITGVTCGANLNQITLSGSGSLGTITGWPTTIDFGSANCGGPAPAHQGFQLVNPSPVDVHLTHVAISQGFTTTVATGDVVTANGGGLPIRVFAPAVPAAQSPQMPITGTLTLQTDAANDAPHDILLTEEPQGAVLAFDTSATPGFGDFGQVVLLQSATQSFKVTNTGVGPATVTLTTAPIATGDAGVDAADDASSPDATAADAGTGDADTADATLADASTPDATGLGTSVALPFSVSTPTFTIAAGGSQSEVATFSPIAANAATGSIRMIVSGPICGSLPSPLAVSGIGIGGGPTVSPTAVSFLAPCGGPPPQAQAFVVTNSGNADMTWDLSSPSGPGAAQYTLKATPPPGLLMPGQSAAIIVSAAAVPSPAPNLDGSALAASVTVTTDVPLDPPHVVSLGETPVGDQLWLSQSSLRYGQVPIGSSITQSFTVTNAANAESPPANLSFTVQGPGATAYSVVPAMVTGLAGGVSASESVPFAPTAGMADPATLSIATTDNLCTSLPQPIILRGTGTQGTVSLSASTLAFGTDPQDGNGFVNCGATGPYQYFNVANVGNQTFHITGLSLGLGAQSPYVLSGPGTMLPAVVSIGGSVLVTVTPNAIPALVANPNDPSPFTDTLTITTDAAGDSPHAVKLVMQARGAVIAARQLPTSWSFGTVGVGSIGTYTVPVENSGNAPATVELDGLSQPKLFGLQNNPATVAANAVGSIVGQFSPPSPDGSWSDQGTLVVKAAHGFCAPLPTQWSSPAIALSGASNSSPPVTVSGNLVFPSTNCGSASPAAQDVTLTNATNVPYAYTLNLNSGAFYTIQNPGPGTVPAGGSAIVAVAPVSISPGPGVVPGQAPYADQLAIHVATSPATNFTVPIAWTLNGAVLTLPSGAGTNKDAQGNPFYPADSTSGFTLTMGNSGTATATVSVTTQPPNAFSFSPAAPAQVAPGIPITLELTSGSAAGTCPTTTSATATFGYAGPVCQPFPSASVNVRACNGTIP